MYKRRNNMTFVKIQLGDLVFDKQQKVDGKVTFINNKDNTAKVEVITNINEETGERTTKLVECRLFNLTVYKRKQQKKSFDNNRSYTLVKEFHKAFNHPVAYKPTPMEAKRALDRTVWTGEELVEFLHASSSNKEEFNKLFAEFIKGMEVAYDKSLKDEFITNDLDKVVAQADALTDASYFINGSFVETGVKPQPLFEIVQAANMSKLFTDENGNKYAKYREDGKILKSPEFFSPEAKLKEEIERQSK